METIVQKYDKGQMSLRLWNKLIPAVNVIVELMEALECCHVGFMADGEIDHSQFEKIEDEIDWIMSDYTDNEQVVMRKMVNYRMMYDEVSEEG